MSADSDVNCLLNICSEELNKGYNDEAVAYTLIHKEGLSPMQAFLIMRVCKNLNCNIKD